MKKYILLFLSFFLSLTISACAAQDSPVPAPAETARTESGENVREKGEALMRIQITANGRTWQAEPAFSFSSKLCHPPTGGHGRRNWKTAPLRGRLPRKCR